MTLPRILWFACALGVLMLPSCTGCHQDKWLPDRPVQTSPKPQDFVEFQRQRALAIDSLINAQTATWDKVTRTGTGIWYQRLDSIPGAQSVESLQEGSVLEIHHRFELLDGRIITDWTADGPLAFEPGSTDLPSGFHELFGLAHLGDSLRAILPPIRAWGMSGLPPDIPQEAVIAIHCRVDLYRRPA